MFGFDFSVTPQTPIDHSHAIEALKRPLDSAAVSKKILELTQGNPISLGHCAEIFEKKAYHETCDSIQAFAAQEGLNHVHAYLNEYEANRQSEILALTARRNFDLAKIARGLVIQRNLENMAQEAEMKRRIQHTARSIIATRSMHGQGFSIRSLTSLPPLLRTFLR